MFFCCARKTWTMKIHYSRESINFSCHRPRLQIGDLQQCFFSMFLNRFVKISPLLPFSSLPIAKKKLNFIEIKQALYKQCIVLFRYLEYFVHGISNIVAVNSRNIQSQINRDGGKNTVESTNTLFTMFKHKTLFSDKLFQHERFIIFKSN